MRPEPLSAVALGIRPRVIISAERISLRAHAAQADEVSAVGQKADRPFLRVLREGAGQLGHVASGHEQRRLIVRQHFGSDTDAAGYDRPAGRQE